MKSIGSAIFLLCVAFVGLAAAQNLAPLMNKDSPFAINGQYVVVLRESAQIVNTLTKVKELISTIDPFDEILTSFEISNFKGFGARLGPALLRKVRGMAEVKYVEANMIVHASDDSCTQQQNAVWGLDRIAERSVNLDGKYPYPTSGGTDVDAYIVDTGINIKHVDFQGRANWGDNFIDTQDTDCNGHGTHVAGTVGSTTYGVAKKTTLIAVKVLDCNGSGTNLSVIDGINWAAAQYTAKKKPSVANMSLGGGKSTALNAAVRAAVKAGLTFVVAAGNENNDACRVSPASAPEAISVGATTVDTTEGNAKDLRTYFSNYGTCVTLFAPGMLIESTWIGPNNNEVKTISGTSMASPHTCGAAALFLGSNPTATPDDVKAHLIGNTTNGIIELECGTSTICKESPNKLLYSTC